MYGTRQAARESLAIKIGGLGLMAGIIAGAWYGYGFAGLGSAIIGALLGAPIGFVGVALVAYLLLVVLGPFVIIAAVLGLIWLVVWLWGVQL